MLLTERKEEDNISYLNSLLNKHIQQGKEVYKAVKRVNDSYSKAILSGRYTIRAMYPESERKLYNSTIIHRSAEMHKSRINNIPYKTENMLTNDDRIRFVNRLEKERRYIKRKREDQLKAEQEKYRLEEQRVQYYHEKEELIRKYNKKQELQNKLNEMYKERCKKQAEFKDQNIILKAKLKEKILLDKMEEKFNDLQNYNLKKRKEKLAEIRALHRSIDRYYIKNHIENIKKIKTVNHSRIKYTLNKSYLGVFKSSWYQQAIEDQQILEHAHYSKRAKAAYVKERLKKFAENIKENFMPEIDYTKYNELKQKLYTSKSMGLTSEEVRLAGLEYLKYSKGQINKKKQQKDNNYVSENTTKKMPNYLYYSKKKNKGIYTHQYYLAMIYQNPNISPQEKAMKVLAYTAKLEYKAYRMYQIDKVRPGGYTEERDKIYYQAIEAKLSLLL